MKPGSTSCWQMDIWGEMVVNGDWRFDGKLSDQINSMSRGQRHMAAYHALRRLQAPLLEIEMPSVWGVDRESVVSLAREGSLRLDGTANERLERLVAEVCSAPGFEFGVDPELAETFQLEAIAAWQVLSESLGEMRADRTDAIIVRVREMAFYLDSWMENSFADIDGEEAREAYLSAIDDDLRDYGLGYFGTRNIEVEHACHAEILAMPSEELFGSPVFRQLEMACDEYSDQLLTALLTLTTR